MPDHDFLHRFLFEHYPIRGQLVHLDTAWRAVLEHAEYPDNIRELLGEASAASALLAATLKFQGHLSLQLRSSGQLSLLLAQCTNGFGVRALARHAPDAQGQSLMQLASGGQLTVILENQDEKQRYQGVVPLLGERLAQCLEVYFEQSEQLPTRLWLYADAQRASGMLLQRLPARETDDPIAVEDAWRRVQLIGDTLQPAELRDLSDREILHRLFNEDDVRLFEPAPVFFRCTCSHERVTGMLLSLGRAEVESVLGEQGRVEVRCDFCNRAYQFDAVDVGRIFAISLGGNGGKVH
ncbi:MAG: Hsp33 family molecular chaperone HslO [Candidatus Obscuribacterales bacterium]|nr:Hsp33 family molecular chaperone HslO [Steroidobacteraceae bacterium]